MKLSILRNLVSKLFKSENMKPKIKKTFYKNGNIEEECYYLNGEWHRENKPARIWYNPNGTIQYEIYYINGEWHREDGPARIWYDLNGNILREEYWIRGERITDEFKILVIQGLGINF